jgi:hypothetical protein
MKFCITSAGFKSQWCEEDRNTVKHLFLQNSVQSENRFWLIQCHSLQEFFYCESAAVLLSWRRIIIHASTSWFLVRVI